MRHAWQQSKPNSEWQQSLCQRGEWLLHCYIVTFVFFHFTFYFLKCGLSVKDIQSDS